MRARGVSGPANLTVTLESQPVAQLSIEDAGEQRFDFSTFAPAGPGHALVLTSDRLDWTLTYLEISNVHGFSEGALNFVIVPRALTLERTIPPWWLLAAGLMLVALQPRFDWPRSRLGRRFTYGAGLGVVGLFALTALVDLVTPFKILLSFWTFLLALALLHLSAFRRIGALRPVLPFVPHVLVTVMVLGGVAQFYGPATGFTSLVAFGRDFEARATPILESVPHAVEAGSGYDGQFYAQVALDPLLQDPSTVSAMDDASYRARRPLCPWLAYAAGLGRPALVLQAYALLNVCSWLVLGCLLLRWLPPGSARSTVAWTACMLSAGLLASLRRALLDGPSALCLALGLMAVERHRHWVAAAVLGATGLGRETNLIGGAALLLKSNEPRRAWARAALQVLVMLAPLLLWLLYLEALGLEQSPGGRNFAAPLYGYVDKWGRTIAELRTTGWNPHVSLSVWALVALTVQAATLVVRPEPHSAWWRLGITYAALLLLLGTAVWEGHPGAAMRVALPMTLAFNVLLPRGRWFWPLLILGNVNILGGLSELRITPLVNQLLDAISSVRLW